MTGWLLLLVLPLVGLGFLAIGAAASGERPFDQDTADDDWDYIAELAGGAGVPQPPVPPAASAAKQTPPPRLAVRREVRASTERKST